MCLAKVGAGNGCFRIRAGLESGSGPCSQIAELQAAGCGNIYKEKASGVRTDRPELAKLIRRLDAGDVMVVTRLDRLARSTRDRLHILDAVGKAGAGFKSLKDTWADTTTPHGRLMLTVLGGLAEFEPGRVRSCFDNRIIRDAAGFVSAHLPKTHAVMNNPR
jgi:DNA invertase Pin-like site-specific DNA recombinase